MNGQHGVAVHVTSNDERDWRMALRNLANLVNDDSVSTPPDAMRLVVNGPAVRFLLASAADADKVVRMVEAGVTVNACSNSLERFDHEPSDLAAGVEPIQSGVAEVLRAQKRGNEYLKLP